MPLTLAEIEDLLLARIRARLPYLLTVDSYQGQIDEKALEDGQVVIRTPAVLALLKKTAGAPLAYGEGEETYEFTLIVACRNLRGQEAARREDQGVYQILQDLRRGLWDHSLAPELQPLDFVQDDAFFVTREWAIYFATYTVKQEVETDD